MTDSATNDTVLIYKLQELRTAIREKQAIEEKLEGLLSGNVVFYARIFGEQERIGHPQIGELFKQEMEAALVNISRRITTLREEMKNLL